MRSGQGRSNALRPAIFSYRFLHAAAGLAVLDLPYDLRTVLQTIARKFR